MKTALLRLFSSMKFWTVLLWMVLTPFAAWLGRHGFDLNDANVAKVAEYMTIIFGVLLGGQALTDHGKSKAEIENRDVQSGFATNGVMLLLAGVGCLAIGIGLAACAAIKSETKAAAKTFVDCGKPQLVEAAGELGSVLQPAVEQLLSDTGHVDKSGFRALVGELKSDAAGCAIAAVVSRLTAPRNQGAPLASPLAVDAAELQATWTETRREQFGGRTFELGAGS